MADVPLILVVGGDALAVRVCAELCSAQGHRVALVWPHDDELRKQLERIKCEYLPFALNDFESLRSAGVSQAASLMALSEDDRINLQVALKARDINPQIRIVVPGADPLEAARGGARWADGVRSGAPVCSR